MTATCKYCRAQGLEWKQTLGGDWHLMAADGFRHHCGERYAALKAEQAAAPKRKVKHGSFLRLYGPRKAPTHAVLIETKIDLETPAGFYLEPTKSTFEEVQKGRRWPYV